MLPVSMASKPQIRALTSQVEQLAEQMRTISREPRRSDAGGGYRPSTMAEPSGMAAAPAAGGFGTTAVTAPTGDPIGSLIAGGTQREATMQPPPGAGATPGAVTAAPIVPQAAAWAARVATPSRSTRPPMGTCCSRTTAQPNRLRGLPEALPQ